MRKTQEEQLAYYTVRAPYDGVVGDIPVHVGDYVSPSTLLDHVDEYRDLEAYIYIPTERSSRRKAWVWKWTCPTPPASCLRRRRSISFRRRLTPLLQGILVKAPVHRTPEIVRNAQMIKARVIWNTKPMAVIPVLAVTRQGGQTFVFVVKQQDGHSLAVQTPVTLGDTVGNNYSIISGLNAGDNVVVSSTQFLVNGMPVLPLGA